jgi:hypothetical protein
MIIIIYEIPVTFFPSYRKETQSLSEHDLWCYIKIALFTETKRRHIPENSNNHNQHHKNLKPYMSYRIWGSHRGWRWRRLASPKRRLTFNGLHGVVSQRRELLTRHMGPLLCNVCIPHGSAEVSRRSFSEENLGVIKSLRLERRSVWLFSPSVSLHCVLSNSCSLCRDKETVLREVSII